LSYPHFFWNDGNIRHLRQATALSMIVYLYAQALAKVNANKSVLSWRYRDAIADHPLNCHLDLLILRFRIYVWLKATYIQRAFDQRVGIRAGPAGINDEQVNITGNRLLTFGVRAKQHNPFQWELSLQCWDALTQQSQQLLAIKG
jgi:hypothetical protein